jgi:hypothetical protein
MPVVSSYPPASPPPAMSAAAKVSSPTGAPLQMEAQAKATGKEHAAALDIYSEATRM